MYELGKKLRKRYESFLGPNYVFNEVESQSTEVRRAVESLQLVLAGLNRPKGTPMEWNPSLNWVPSTYKVLSNKKHVRN